MGWMVRNTPDNWWHDGALPGTRTEMVRTGNGFTWLLLCNTRAYNDTAFFNDMDNLGWHALAAVSTWPTNDLFDSVLSYAAWQARHFNSAQLANPAVSGDTADPDADGLANCWSTPWDSIPCNRTCRDAQRLPFKAPAESPTSP